MHALETDALQLVPGCVLTVRDTMVATNSVSAGGTRDGHTPGVPEQSS